MDIQMPIMDGKEATCILRQNPDYQSLPVIALTAAVTDEEREIYLNVGLSDIVAKPIKPDILIAMLNKWILGNDQSSPLS
jgi:CheY-like chemotaxis protein